MLVRNPYFHRVDSAGRQLPYIDRVIVGITDDKLIPAKTGAGDVDLQARYLRFDNYTFLKQAREAQPVSRAAVGEGARLADRALSEPQRRGSRVAQADARRALPPRAVARHQPARNQRGRLLRARPRSRATRCCSAARCSGRNSAPRGRSSTSKAANALLDAIGLTKRDADGLRLLPDGRPMELIIDTSGESTEETDVLELIRDSWRKLGIAMFSRPSQREVFRKRVFSGKSMMSVWSGLSNGIPTPEMSPRELAPTAQEQLQWPMWGQYYETEPQGRRGADVARRAGAGRALRGVAQLGERRRARKDLAADARDQRRAGVHDRHRHARAAAGRRARQPAQRARQRASTAGTRAPTSACTTPTRSGSTTGERPLMLQYVVNRMLLMIPTMIAISIIVFTIIQLPPGNYLESYIAELQAQGESVDPQKIAFLREYYGLDKPLVEQYLRWVGGMLQRRFRLFVRVQHAGDEGRRRPDVPDDHRVVRHDPLHVGRRVSDRHLFGDAPVQLGRLRAVAARLPRHRDPQLHARAGDDVRRERRVRHEHRRPDGARIHRQAVDVGQGQVGAGAQLDSGRRHRHERNRGDDPAPARQPARRAAEAVRRHRARAKGLPPRKVLRKYPLRMALNFFISDIGSLLPHIISGAEITAVVLSLPTTGPMLLNALKSQDMYLAGSFLMFLALLIVVGVLVSDLALVALDPRIRLQGGVAR